MNLAFFNSVSVSVLAAAAAAAAAPAAASLGARGLALCLVGALAVGCGHPASVKECEEIADRVTELELSSSPVGRDPDTAKEQLQRTRAWVKESQLKSCVGRRITDSAMRCVRTAKKAEDITDRCFR